MDIVLTTTDAEILFLGLDGTLFHGETIKVWKLSLPPPPLTLSLSLSLSLPLLSPPSSFLFLFLSLSLSLLYFFLHVISFFLLVRLPVVFSDSSLTREEGVVRVRS